MNKQIVASSIALLILLTTICFPAQTVYAEGEETPITAQSDGVEVVPQEQLLEVENAADSIDGTDGLQTDIESTYIMTADFEMADGYVYSFEDFKNQLSEGGTVNLGANITIPYDEDFRCDGFINVSTGQYGIIVEGNMGLGYGFNITGDGDLQPVVEVLGGGRLSIYNSENGNGINATSDNGRGLVLRSGSEYNVDIGNIVNITANGANGTALESEIPLDLSYHCIEAQNGKGIVSNNEVILFLCKVLAATEAVEAPSFTADTCNLSPEANNNGTIINRIISKISINRDYIALGDSIPENYFTGHMREIITLHAEGYEDIYDTTFLMFDVPEIDINVIGTYPFGIRTTGWWSDFDIVPEDVALFHIEIYDPTIPYFDSTFSSRGMYYLQYLYSADDLSALTLWRSDDEGVTWQDYTADTETDFDGEVLTLILNGKEDHPVLYVWEVEGLGESQILRVTWNGFTLDADLGGDRTGGDRGETKPPDSVGNGTPTIPPPTDTGDGTTDTGTETPTDTGNGTTTPPTDTDTDTDTDTPTTKPTDTGNETPTTTPTKPGNGTTTPTDTGKGTTTTTPTETGNGTTTIPPTKPDSTPTTRPPVATDTPDKEPESNADNTAILLAKIPQMAAASITPQPAQVKTAIPTTVKPTEYEDENSVTVSGKRLAVMMEVNREYVTFMRGDLRIEVPVASLKSLDLNNTDTLKVTLYQPDKHSFTIDFDVNGKPLIDQFSEPFLVSLPWGLIPLSCISPNGESTEAVLVDSMATFSLRQTGNYTLMEQAVTALAITQNNNLQTDKPTTTTELISADKIALQSNNTQPHSDNFVPVVLGGVSLAGGLTILGFTLKRRVIRP